MKKIRYAVVMSLLLVVAAVSAAFADGLTIVNYNDTGSNGYTPNQGDDPVSYIDNGDFNGWGDEFVWNSWADSAAGWEVRGAKTDLSEGGEGISYGMGFFIRNTGGSDGAYAGLVQEMVNIPASGQYFVNVSATAFWDVATGPYNSVAWYAISDSATASGVMADEWKELYSDTTVCENKFGNCTYVGRDEMVSINPGQYFHVKVGQKFPIYQANTVFIIDDISVVAENTEMTNENGFYNWMDQNADPSCKWHSGDACANQYDIVTWDPSALR